MRPLAALLLVAVGLGPPARAQALVWERVGRPAYGVSHPSIAPDGTMWATGYEGALRLDPPYGPDQTWTSVINEFHGSPMLALGPDTLVAVKRGPYRSVDGGETFQPMTATGWLSVGTFVEIPLGLPNGGALVGGTRSNYFAVYSHDRGATWARTAIPNNDRENPAADDFAVVRRGERAGRIVGAGKWGLATSDDGGASFAPVPGRWAHFRFYSRAIGLLEGAAPDGGDRLVATMIDSQDERFADLVLVSDDGGDTWRETFALTGDPNAASAAVVDLGDGRAVVVMDGGHVWQSEDAGETWAIVGVVPGALMDPVAPGIGRTQWAMRGKDGRLYVGGNWLGGSNPGWAFRTKTPFVTGEAGPPVETSAARLSVEPNPSSGAVRVSLVLPEAGEATLAVFDALGRRVAVLHDGTVQAGTLGATFDAGTLPAGVYVVRAVVRGADGSPTVLAQRVVVAR